VLVKQDATDLERAETALMQAQIDRLFQVGELIRNELDNDREPGAVRLTGCASWSADPPDHFAIHAPSKPRSPANVAAVRRRSCGVKSRRPSSAQMPGVFTLPLYFAQGSCHDLPVWPDYPFGQGYSERTGRRTRVDPLLYAKEHDLDRSSGKRLDEWRRKEDDLPNRREAIRRPVGLGLRAKTKI
jgi:hypothetical protein